MSDNSDRFTVTLNAADFGTFNSEYCQRLGRAWRSWLWGLSFALVMFVLIFGTLWLVGLIAPDLPVELRWVVLILVAFIVPRWLLPLMTTRFAAVDLSPLMHETRFEVREGGLFSQTIDCDNLWRWAAFKDMLVTPRAAYLGLGANRAVIVPRRAFADAAAFDAFLADFRAKTGLT